MLVSDCLGFHLAVVSWLKVCVGSGRHLTNRTFTGGSGYQRVLCVLGECF